MPPKRSSDRSLRVSNGFRDYVVDQLGDLGSVLARSMFGGVGLYCGGLFFGIIARDVLYLKVDDVNRSEFERAGMQPFRPYPDRAGTMQYFAVPIGVLENAPELVKWARGAVAAAGRAASAAPRP
jgi:DNA transformation protein